MKAAGLDAVLGPAEREHLHRILVSAGSSPIHDRVREVLRRDVRFSEEAVAAWRAVGQRERERALSELVWRVTCHLDGSVTRVLGVNTYELGYGFAAVQTEEDGRDVFCITNV
jgi:hypothetical protein